MVHKNVKDIDVPIGGWIKDAKCRDADADDVANKFFGIPDMQVFAVREYCNVCPVKEECLETALANREVNGVWGGTTEDGRRSLLRKIRSDRRKSA